MTQTNRTTPRARRHRSRCALAFSLTLGLLLFGCSSSPPPPGSTTCGSGQLLSKGGAIYCVYHSSIIEDGFHCPTAFPFEQSLAGYTICSQGTLPDDFAIADADLGCNQAKGSCCTSGGTGPSEPICFKGNFVCPSGATLVSDASDPLCALSQKRVTLTQSVTLSSEAAFVTRIADLSAEIQASDGWGCAEVDLSSIQLRLTTSDSAFTSMRLQIGLNAVNAPSPARLLAVSEPIGPSPTFTSGAPVALSAILNGVLFVRDHLLLGQPIEVSYTLAPQSVTSPAQFDFSVTFVLHKDASACRPPFLSESDATKVNCTDLLSTVDALEASIAATCQQDSDCILVGGNSSCDCNNILKRDSGVGVNKEAEATLLALWTTYQSATCDAQHMGICDALPIPGVACENFRCTTSLVGGSCLMP
ncbi:MAG: hypothetical protein KC609_26370 [Myxococcales bacterium]|nr:hypothetical protein [Myxococcales bacterium]